jgi:type II secretory pathway component GspD/PulD (secretin)
VTKLPLGLALLLAASFAVEGCASKPAVAVAPPSASRSLAPLIPIQERADGRPVITHMVEISGRMIRFQGKMPEAKGALGFLTDKAGLRAGAITLTKQEADAALDALVRATIQEVKATPKVSVGAGQPARIGIAQELRYPTGWKKNTELAGGWMATKVEMQNLGTMMRVFPQLATDGSIQLEVTLDTTEFDGFVLYEAPTEKSTSITEFVAVNEPVASGRPPVAINMGPHAEPFAEPIFSTQTVTANGRIADGKTLVLCGEITRRNGSPDKLLVFLTATASPLKRAN